jgi:hypothetical protein
MWESLIAVYGNWNSGERLPSECTMDRIDFIDPKRLTDDLTELHEATTYGLATSENKRNIARRVPANIFKS